MTEGIRQPILRTARLVLRAFRASDAGAVALLAGDVDIARNTLNIPHPYTPADAEAWIGSHPAQLQRREAVTYAITRAEEGVVGAAGLILALEHGRAELGYWIGRPYWGRGYATEASRAVVAWGFRSLELHRVHAGHFPQNPASGRVMHKLGMRYEGRSREHVRKWDDYLDLDRFGILRSEFDDGAADADG
ncbi:MAG: GNAT family N-acetyltransferase [Gemmatimonadota bacterium]